MRLKIIISLCLLISLVSIAPSVQAQNDQKLVLLCVVPNDPENGTPYVIGFRNTPLFGVVIPIEANVTVFSNQSVNAALLRVTTDAPTGGYHLGIEVARLTSAENLLNNTDCAEDISQLSKTLNISVNQNTFHIPVSAQYGLTVQVGGSDKLASPYLGVFAFRFQSSVDNHLINFHVAHINPNPSEATIELTVSRVTPDTPASFIVIGNKFFDVLRSGLANPDNFSSPAVAEKFDYLTVQFSDKMPAMFDMMQTLGIPIYPSNILGLITPQIFDGGYLQLRPEGKPAQRVPEFAADSTVSPLTENIEARLFLPNRPGEPVGKLVGTNSLTVVRVDDNGQLIVRTQDGQEAIIEAWRVKVN